VRCPACNFIGEEALFRDGCPVCGHTAGKPGSNRNNKRGLNDDKKPAGALPVWAYILAAAALIFVLAALFMKIA
jgi:transposase